MEEQLAHLADGELLAVIDRCVDLLTDDRMRLPTDRDQLDQLHSAVRVTGRLHAYQARLAARVEGSDAAWREHQTSASTWLADVARLTRREAGHLIHSGQRLDRFTVVGDAAVRGEVLPGQAEAITGVLDKLPDTLPTQEVERGQELMVGFAATLGVPA